MNYLICATPRTGSNWLCDMLAKTGVAGIVDINQAGFFIGSGEGLRAAGVYPERVDEYLNNVRTPNGVSGCKLMFDYLDHLDDFLPFGAIDDILARFDKFIWLQRQDTLRQAISWFVARRTRHWTSLDAENPRRKSLPVEFNFARLVWYRAKIAAENTRFELFFEDHSITPHVVYYEETLSDSLGTVNGVLEFLELDTRVEQVASSLKRQTDPRKEEYYRLYERRAIGAD